MKRTAELVIILLGCAVVFSQVARDHRAPAATASPVAVATRSPLNYYKCAHEFSDPQSESLLERAYSNTKDPKCLELFDQLLAREPRSPIGYYQKGDALYDQDRYPEAIAALDKAIALEPGFANALYLRACCHDVMDVPRGWEAGLKDIELALSLDEDAENHSLRSSLLLQLKRTEEALLESDLAVKIDATRDVLEQRANVYESLGRTKDAERDRKRAEKLPED